MIVKMRPRLSAYSNYHFSIENLRKRQSGGDGFGKSHPGGGWGGWMGHTLSLLGPGFALHM